LQAAGDVRVEVLSLGSQTMVEQAAQLRAGLPRGLSVWFLRWQGAVPRSTKPNAPPPGPLPTDPHLYGLTHPYAVFVQGKDGVLAPISEADSPVVGFLREIRTYRTLSSFARALSS
jgi:hypothetical protein